MTAAQPPRFEARRWAMAGIVATFAAASAGYWMPGLSLPRLDFAGLNGNLIAPESSGASFVWLVGLVDTFALGIVAALIYGRYVRRHLPGSGPVRGLVWGLVVCAVVGLTAFPLLFGAGVFGLRWDATMPIALVLWHAVWGASLGLADDTLSTDSRG